MASISSIPSMRARALTIMATRAQDQDLVASVAAEQGIRDCGALQTSTSSSARVVPAFGWHPWFSHQLYDDTEEGASEGRTYDASGEEGEQKMKHYAAVLSPVPDAEFVASLPTPVSLKGFIEETRRRVREAGTAAIIGEIGLDKAFRLPWPWNASEQAKRDAELTPGGREGRMLSPHHVRMPHQVRVLKAQLRLAGELGVAVSVHGVQGHGVLFDAMAGLWKGFEKEVVSRRKQKMVATGAEDFSSSEEEEDYSDEEAQDGERRIAGKRYKPKPFPPRVCLHSFSGSPQMLSQYLNPAIPLRAYFSFSTVINLSTAGGESKFPELIRACPDDRLLVESDLHCAGEDMDGFLEDMYRKVCEIKGWGLDEGVERIRRNYEGFIFG